MIELIKNLLHDFKLNPGASAEDLNDLLAYVGSELPEDYIELLKLANGASGWLRGRYLIIFSASDVINVNGAAGTKACSPGRLIVASNGGGTSYLVELGKPQFAGFYRCEDVDLGHDEPQRVATSVAEFIGIFGPQIG